MKILIVRFSSIGDIILTTPVIRCCAKQIPNAEIHFLTKPVYANLLHQNPYLTKVWKLHPDLDVMSILLNEVHFDIVLDLHNNLRTRILSKKLNAPFIRFDKINIAKWLFVHKLKKTLPRIHIVDRYMQTAKSLDVKNDAQGLNYFLTESFYDRVIDIPLHPFVCYAIGGQLETKKLPVAKIIELCQKIEVPIVLIGGKEDVTIGQEVSKICKNVQSFCGELSINHSAIVISKSRLVLTHDTGMMHIASALKKDIFSIWGNTIPEFGMYPYLPGSNSEMFQVRNLGCRPCSKIGYQSCPNYHFKCMNNQDLDRIAGRINGLFSRKEQ